MREPRIFVLTPPEYLRRPTPDTAGRATSRPTPKAPRAKGDLHPPRNPFSSLPSSKGWGVLRDVLALYPFKAPTSPNQLPSSSPPTRMLPRAAPAAGRKTLSPCATTQTPCKSWAKRPDRRPADHDNSHAPHRSRPPRRSRAQPHLPPQDSAESSIGAAEVLPHPPQLPTLAIRKSGKHSGIPQTKALQI